MFDRIEIAENIYEGVVEPSYKKPNRGESTHDGHSRKIRVISSPSKSNPDIGGRTGNHKKSYVDCTRSGLQLTCLIHGHGNSLDH